MVFGLKDSTKIEDCGKNEMSLVDSLFHAVKGVSKLTPSKSYSLGKWSQNKIRPIKMIFKDLEEKKLFIFSPYKFKTADEELKKAHVGPDLSP